MVVETRSAEETRRLGAAISPVLVPGDMIVLSGDLGAGKTTFTQGVAAGLGIVEQVTSATFILMKEYSGGRFPLMHLDIYRLEKIQELIDLGYDEFLDPSYVVIVEWGDVVEPLLPKEHLLVELRHTGDPVETDRLRTVSLVPKGPAWQSRMPTIQVLSEELFSVGREADPGYFGEFRAIDSRRPGTAN
ncbi:MAG: tRNA (adenosine(37)-N6)-threonylcarbamoyltransferase complex ATPase subunit type 1 TsaE [Actinomycetota bacterium]